MALVSAFLLAENENRQLEDLPLADFGRLPERLLLSVRTKSINENFVNFFKITISQNSNFRRVTILQNGLFSPCGDNVTSFMSQKYMQTLQIRISPKSFSLLLFLKPY